MTNIVLATRAGVSRIFFGILQVNSLNPMVDVSFLPSYPLLISLPIVKGLVVANGKDDTSETRWESQKNSYPYGSMRGAGIVSPVRLGRPGTFF
jgi:hypothetical protein